MRGEVAAGNTLEANVQIDKIRDTLEKSAKLEHIRSAKMKIEDTSDPIIMEETITQLKRVVDAEMDNFLAI